MKHSGLLLILIFFIITGLKATQVTDSLERLLQTTTDTSRVKILCDLCWEYRFISAEKALEYGNEAMLLSKNLNFEKGIAQAFNDMGIVHIDQGRYTKANDFFNSAMQLRTKLHDSAGMASLFNKIGIVYQKQGKLKKALENQIEALKIYEALKQDLWIGYCLNNIAIIHQNLGDLDKSLEYHHKALEYRIKMGDEYGEAGSYGNIANVYVKQGDTALAVQYYEKALTTFRKIKNDEGTSAMLSNLGNIYLARNQNEKAMAMLNESLQLREKIGDKKGIASSLIKIGEAYTNQGRYPKAKSKLFRGLTIAQNIGVMEEEVAAYLAIAKMYALEIELDSAFYFTQTYINLKDSLYKVRLNEQIVEVQTKYETDKIERENELLASKIALTESRLKQRKTEIWLLISMIISISGATIFLLYRRRQKQKEALDAAVIRHNEEQLKAVLEGQEDERRRIARELHDGVGQTLAGIKLNWEDMSGKFKKPENIEKIGKLSELLDSVSSEVRSISHQMMPKELEQFGLIPALESMLNGTLNNTKIKFSLQQFGMDERLYPEIELSLFRISQELTSNVIRHSQAKNVDVQLLRRNGFIVFVFSDDGIGFDMKPGELKGIGMINIESRVQSINGNLNIESTKQQGTTFTIRIPV
jgi:two-component system, NarL family, sensor kinase